MNPESHTRPSRAEQITIADLQPGQLLCTPLYNADGLLLLVAGSIIRADDLRLLAQREIVFGYTAHRREVQDEPPGNVRRELDAPDLDPASCVVPIAGGTDRPRCVLPPAAFKAEVSAGIEQCRTATDSFQGIATDIRCGKLRTAHAAEELVERFLGLLSMDSDLLPAISAVREAGEEYLFIHSVNVAMLSVTAGEALGLSDAQLLELGVGAMLMDIGMLKVPQELRLAGRDLEPDEWYEIQRHPSYTLDMLEKLSGITPGMMFVGYQAHERGDGSGYPRERTERVMHTYARIVAIADTFMAMTSPRPYRPAFTPYEAMKTLLHLGARYKFDRTVLRAFLDRMSLFPVGSYVQLSTGDIAKVIRPNVSAHTKPIVAVVLPDGTEQDRFIDLTRSPDVSVTGAFGMRPPARTSPTIASGA